jgi:hypothetical protein
MPDIAISALAPDMSPLTSVQAQRFAALAAVPLAEVEGRSIAELSQSLKWQVDPDLFGFTRVCGQVVCWDQPSGQYQPVPFATVHVMDTECDFLGYLPFNSKWSWLYPLCCRTDEVKCVTTDACGKFCVWVPRFDIEWVVRWRREYLCFPEIFVRPDLTDLLVTAGIIEAAGDRRVIDLRAAGVSLDRLSGIVGRPTASRLLQAGASASVGGSQSALRSLLSQPAFPNRAPPPFSPRLQALASGEPGALQTLVRPQPGRTHGLDLQRYAGPFPAWRCEVVTRAELVPIFAAPDITFWVTQDVDGDGNQETIFDDGWFQVGWQSGPLDDVTLYCCNARVSGSCEAPPVGDCQQPEIGYAGLMPATPSYIDTSALPSATRGCSIRVNPPHTDGEIRPSVFPPAFNADPASSAPFMGTVELYGCNQYPGGAYYRLLYSFNGAAQQPFTGLTWDLDPLPGPGTKLKVTADAQGWYPILNNPGDWWPPNELLDWPTTSYPDGIYDVTIQIADATKTVIFTSPEPVPFQIDNSVPQPLITSLAWSLSPSGPWTAFPTLICPVVDRPAGTAISFRVQYTVTGTHPLQSEITASGCGGGAMTPSPEPDALPYLHHYENAADSIAPQTAIFTLPGSALAGCYGFTVTSYSRSFNPAGGDASNPQANDWYVDTASLNYTDYSVSVAVVDA